jgi:two-component system LytT family response regulator
MDKIFRAVIIDDEELSRTDLKLLLTRFPTVEVVGEAKDISTGSVVVSKLNPDVIFLDIEFPRESGFDLLEKIETRAKIVFVTAFDEYAIRAFEVNALDYLLKPVNPDRLAITLKHKKYPLYYAGYVQIKKTTSVDDSMKRVDASKILSNLP